MNRRWLILLVVAFFLIVVLGAVTVTPRSDRWFAEHFQKHRHEMEKLVTLLQTSQLISVQRLSDSKEVLLQRNGEVVTEVTSLSPNGSILLGLFDSIGCDYVSQVEGETTILLPRHGWEDLYPGGYKVFVFRQSAPQRLVESLDEHRRRNRGQYRFYRPLEGGWFLKYEEAH